MLASVFITVTSGVLIFIIGQIILKLILDPAVKLKETIGNVSALFLREQNKITNLSASDETLHKMKELASSLMAQKQAIPLYTATRFIAQLPPEKCVENACGQLNQISGLAGESCSKALQGNNGEVQVINAMDLLGKNLNTKVSYIT